MIISTSRIKASSGGRKLWNHLQKTAENEQIHVLAGDQATLDDWVSDARAAGVKYGVRHVSISPDREMTRDQALDAARLWAEEFGADPEQLVIVEHVKKRVGADEPTRHWHIAAPEYDPAERRVMDSSWNYIRNEVVARQIEHRCGHESTPGRHTGPVIEMLRGRGLYDVAEAVDRARSAERPTAAYSKRQHQRAKRQGHDLPKIREAVQAAWAKSDTAEALRSALAEHGLEVAQGERQWIVRDTATQDELGALARLAKQKKQAVEARMATSAPTQEKTDERPLQQRADGQDRSEARPASGPDAAAGGRGRVDRSDRAAAGNLAAAGAGPATHSAGAGRRIRPSRHASAVRLALWLQRNLIRRRTRNSALERDHSHGPGP